MGVPSVIGERYSIDRQARSGFRLNRLEVSRRREPLKRRTQAPPVSFPEMGQEDWQAVALIRIGLKRLSKLSTMYAAAT